ncbi:hypothetical protein V6N13_138851 [Hibiscus sabdariffa]|uniref:Uncharacterized protein n=1 Tax=Hibiscus sabdariffa TaxID=183260 RepID=A0ABR2PKB8_9ROSI
MESKTLKNGSLCLPGWRCLKHRFSSCSFQLEITKRFGQRCKYLQSPCLSDLVVKAFASFASHWRYKEVLEMVEWARWVVTWHCEFNRLPQTSLHIQMMDLSLL